MLLQSSRTVLFAVLPADGALLAAAPNCHTSVTILGSSVSGMVTVSWSSSTATGAESGLGADSSTLPPWPFQVMRLAVQVPVADGWMRSSKLDSRPDGPCLT